MLNSISIFRRISMRHACLLIAFAFLLSACGQKGPLYLPKEKDKPELTEEGTPKPRNGEQ